MITAAKEEEQQQINQHKNEKNKVAAEYKNEQMPTPTWKL